MTIDGNKIAEKILNNLKEKIQEKKLKLGLAVVWVGSNEISRVYVEKKKETAQKIGIGFELFNFPKEIFQSDLAEKVEEISQKEDIAGVVIQLPLPSQIDTDEILKCVSKEKDVEGFVSENLSPIVLAVEEILKEYSVFLKDKKIVLVGRGKLVGQPVAKWLKKQNIDFEVVDKDSQNINKLQEADIIISGAGVPNLIKKNMVKEGVVIIDAGTCKVDGKTVGDVDFKNVCDKAQCITPCIGGIGPVTVACLFKNLVKINLKI